MTTLEPQTGVGLRLDAGQRLTVRDPNGGQVSDFFAVATDDIARQDDGPTSVFAHSDNSFLARFGS